MLVLYFSEVKLFVHAIAKWTKKAIQIVPEYSVRTHKTTPRGIAPRVSSSPLGMCVAEYNAVLTKIEGQKSRYLCIPSYVLDPWRVNTPEHSKAIYGKILPIHLERNKARSDGLAD